MLWAIFSWLTFTEHRWIALLLLLFDKYLLQSDNFTVNKFACMWLYKPPGVAPLYHITASGVQIDIVLFILLLVLWKWPFCLLLVSYTYKEDNLSTSSSIDKQIQILSFWTFYKVYIISVKPSCTIR